MRESGDVDWRQMLARFARLQRDLASRERLLREVRLATHVAKVSRALSWQRALGGRPVPEGFGDPVSGWLAELLADSPC